MSTVTFEKKENEIKCFRNLGQLEKNYHNWHTYRTLLISSKINIYENICLVKEAINEWKSANTLLRCHVVKNENSPHKEDYFVHATQEKLVSFDNVKFLYYNTKLSQSFDQIWKVYIKIIFSF